MDCPYTGKGEEFSPTNLVEAALGGCMLIAMGTIAMRHELDLSGARIDVGIAATDKPVMRFSEVDIEVNMMHFGAFWWTFDAVWCILEHFCCMFVHFGGLLMHFGAF